MSRTTYGWLTDFTDDLRTIRMTYGRYGWVTLVSAHVSFLWRPHHPHVNPRGSELASVAFHQVWELVPVISTVSTPSFWTLVCIMSGRRSSRKTRKNPPVSEQPQQPPQAEEEGQEVEKGPSLAELTVPPPPPPPTKMAVARDVEKRGKTRDKRKRRGKKNLSSFIFF